MPGMARGQAAPQAPGGSSSFAGGHAGETVHLHEVMTKIGLGRFHAWLLAACGLGFAASAVEITSTGFLMTDIKKRWDLSHPQLALIPMAISTGSCIGHPVWGVAADRYGRRFCFTVTMLLCAVGGLLASVSSSLPMFLLMRALAAFGTGGAVPVDFAMFVELLPTEGRFKMLAFMQAFWPLGSCSCALIAWYTIPTGGARACLAWCTVPSLLAVPLRAWLPESPSWLLMHNRHAEAKAVLTSMALWNGKSPVRVGLGDGVQVCLDAGGGNNRGAGDTAAPRASFLELFRGDWLLTTIGVMAIGIGIDTCNYGFKTMMPQLLEERGVTQNDRYLTMLFTFMAQLPGILIAIPASRKVGRLLLLKLSLFPVPLALTLFLHVQCRNSLSATLALGSFFMELSFVLYGSYTAEVYPTELRATALGVIKGLTPTITHVVPLAAAALLASGGIGSAIVLFATAAAAASLVATLCLHIETDGQALQVVASRASTSDAGVELIDATKEARPAGEPRQPT